MSEPNPFLIQRKALARFRKHIPFLALIPDRIYRKLSPLAWYEPFGKIEQTRQMLEEELDCYVMPYKRYGPEAPWEAQLFVHIHEAELPPEKQVVLYAANDVVRRLGIEFQAFQKPLKQRTRPLEDPLAHCDPPDEDYIHKSHEGVDPDEDIPF
jgi:hypothetical protein